MHIFREYSRTSDEPSKSPTTYASAAANGPAQPVEPEESAHANVESDDVTLAVLAVPSWMTPSDFLTFVAPAADGVAHLRMIRSVLSAPASHSARQPTDSDRNLCFRDSAPNRSIVVMKFREPANAAEFAEAYNGKQFNSMEVCHLVHLSIAD